MTTKKDADGFLYEKMYAALPRQEAQLTKIRFWRTGHHVPSDRKQLMTFGKALGLNDEEQLYLLQVYADRSDLVFDASSAGDPRYRERRGIMDTMIREYLDKLHPMERRKYGVLSEDQLTSLRHIYFSQACEYTFRPAESDKGKISRMTSVSYGSELLNNTKLLGDIPRKTMIRHILLMCIPFINERVISTYLSAFGYCPLCAEHTLTSGERFDAMLLAILALTGNAAFKKARKNAADGCRRPSVTPISICVLRGKTGSAPSFLRPWKRKRSES